MPYFNELHSILNDHFKWNKARMTCFILMIIAIIFSRSSNLVKLSSYFINGASQASSYRRVQRFLSDFSINYNHIAHFIFHLFRFKNVHLTLDRSNWKWGKKNINILMLAIIHKGIAIPIFWVLLNKRGNSNTRERIALMMRFIRIFGQDKIESLVADREFIGITWFKWLDQNKIPFFIRIKRNHIVINKYGRKVQIQGLFHDLKQGENVRYSRKIELFGIGCYLNVVGLEKGELLLIASNIWNKNAFDRYANRWEIETLFSCLKGRGFGLEDTHLTKIRRIKRLLAVHAIAFCFAHYIGEWRHEKVKPIIIKNHGRKEKSIFRLGLEFLISIFKKTFMLREYSEIKEVIEILFFKHQNVT